MAWRARYDGLAGIDVTRQALSSTFISRIILPCAEFGSTERDVPTKMSDFGDSYPAELGEASGRERPYELSVWLCISGKGT
jgi:hypothetical protein